MTENKLSFESEKLRVHWVSFTFVKLDPFTRKDLIEYLLKLGFNCKRQNSITKGFSDIKCRFENKFEVIFYESNPTEPTLQFRGNNGTRFYFLAKKGILSWKLFSNATLSRLDLKFDREPKTTDQISSVEFVKKGVDFQKIFRLEQNEDGIVLWLGNRGADLCFRIYKRTENTFLSFELEMKRKEVRAYNTTFISNSLECFDELEHKLSLKYRLYVAKKLPLKYPQLDWLVKKLRPMRPICSSKSSSIWFFNDYANLEYSKTFEDRRKVIDFLGLLAYIKTIVRSSTNSNLSEEFFKKKDNTELYLNMQTVAKKFYEEGNPYQTLVFKLRDFVKFQDPRFNSSDKNYDYQLKNLRQDFFDKDKFQEIQKKTILTFFDDQEFISLVTIPFLHIKKTALDGWVVCLLVSEKLLDYKYPFIMPNFFKIRPIKDNFDVYFEVIKVFSTVNIRKEFSIEKFFRFYKGAISHKREENILKLFVELINILRDCNFIEKEYEVVVNDQFLRVEKLTPENIKKGFVVYEKISLSAIKKHNPFSKSVPQSDTF